MDDRGRFLKEKFEDAGLDVRILDRPARVWNGNVFTLDVDVKRAGTRVQETFRLFPGNADVRVLDVDQDHKQLVLLVAEPVRRFTTRRWDEWRNRHVEDVHTAGGKSKYLVGMDERSYFMAPVASGVTTVRDAHRALKPQAVAEVESRGKKGGKIVRQGEWFFIPAPEFDPGKDVIKRKAPLPGEGKPHVADELVGSSHVRGAVRHPDHKTVSFSFWHRVVPNTEVRVAGPRFSAVPGEVRWID